VNPHPESRIPNPESPVSRRINAERIVLLGWGRAILLQLAHPLIAAGVHDHSGFRSTTWAAVTRLYHTIHAMLALTFGADDERERALGGIRQIHKRVHGQLKSAAGRFLVGPLTASERDAYCAEAAPLAVALLARSHEVPRTWAEARAYLDRVYASGDLVVSEQAQELAHAVLSPSAAAWIAAPATWTNRIVTLGLLPPQIRGQYQVGWTRGNQRTFKVMIPTLRALRRVMPDAIALWPESRIANPQSPITNQSEIINR